MENQSIRIVELEQRLSHNEKTMADLNEMVTTQWHKIEALERQIIRLGNEMQDMSASVVPVERPPHY